MSIWGKILGGAAGLAIGGPIGAIIGVGAGHVADRTIQTLSGRAPGGRMARQIAFTTAVIVLGAKMAKADGVVTRDEIAAFREVFQVPPGEVKAGRPPVRYRQAGRRRLRALRPAAPRHVP